MADQSISVSPGIVTTLNVRLANGATIQNLDSANAIWVSTNPGLVPGVGSRIGPKGSLQWTTDGAPCYAVVDTGVIAAVSTTISTDVSNPVNPVDIGVAVATQLLAQGVPSVYLGKTVGQGTSMPVLFTNNYGYQNVDVSQYSCATVSVNLNATGYVNINFQDVNGNNLESRSFPITKTGGTFTFSVPISGPIMNVTVTSAQNTNSYSVTVSNRSIDRLRIPVSSINAPKFNTGNIAFTAGTLVDFPGFPYISGGGQTYVRALMTGTGKGLFGFRAFDINANPATYDFADTSYGKTPSYGSATEIETELILPAGQLQLYVNPQISATFAAEITLIQST